MNFFKRVLSLLPFICICVATLICWYEIVINEYIATIRHIITPLLLLVNIGIYFFNFKKGLALTAFILLLASFGLIAITLEITEHSLFIKIGSLKISTPPIHYLSLLLFIIFCVLNFEVVKAGINKT